MNIVLRARRNKKIIKKTKIRYLESQQNALLKLNNIYFIIYKSNGEYSYN